MNESFSSHFLPACLLTSRVRGKTKDITNPKRASKRARKSSQGKLYGRPYVTISNVSSAFFPYIKHTRAHINAHNPPLPHGTMVAEVHFSPNSKKENLHNICYDFIFFPWWPFSPPPVPRPFLTLSRSKCLFEPFYSHTLTHV